MWRIRTHRRYGWLVACCAITTVAGILLVLAQFAHYLGWPQVLAYWQGRLGDRSMNTSDYGWTGLAVGIARNIVSGYLPLICLIAWAWWRNRPVLIREHRWVIWALSGVLVYNGLFLNWSAEHEFAGMALALVGTLAMALFSSQTFLNPRPWPIVLAAMASVAIYFYINRPGPKSWKDDAYASQQQLGEAIAQNVDADAVIFTNLVNDKIVEYYAMRTFNPAQNYSHALQLTDSLKPGQAVWLDIQDGKIKTLRPLH
jgi:hypothetical protein